MAALTLAHDLLEAQNPGMVQSTVPVDTGEARRKVERMVQRADDAIESHQNALF